MNNQTIRRTGLMEKSLLPNLFDFNWERGIGCGGERECVGGAAFTLFPGLTPPSLSQGTMEHRRKWDAATPTRSHSTLLQYLSLSSTVEVQTNLVTKFSPFYLFFLLFAYPLLQLRAISCHQHPKVHEETLFEECCLNGCWLLICVYIKQNR